MTHELIAVSAGSLVGLGIFVMIAVARGRLSLGERNWRSMSGATRNIVIATAVLITSLMLTGWVLVSVTAALVAGMSSSAFSTHGRRRDDRVLVEAVAVWTEQLRDMLAGSNGLEQAIAATAPHAPASLRQPLERMAASMSYSSLEQALQRFAREVDHPTADFVVAALSTAATRQVRELGPLLGHLASCAHAESRMHTRIWVSRARTRSAVRIIGGVVTVFVAGLALLSPDYLSPYQTAEGQVVLSAIVLVFFGALLLMQRFAVVAAPERFIGRRSGQPS